MAEEVESNIAEAVIEEVEATIAEAVIEIRQARQSEAEAEAVTEIVTEATEPIEATPLARTKDPQPQPQAPAGPSIKFSQILPMVVMFALQKFNLEELGYVHHVEAAFAFVQLVCMCIIFFVYTKIGALPDTGPKIKIPEVKQFGQVKSPEKQQTPKEYDMGVWKEQLQQAVMGAVILGGVYYKWQYLMPLVLQVFMTPMQIFESPLFQMHVLGRPLSRPFPAANPFGLPSAPAAEPEAAELEAEETPAVADGKKEAKKLK